MKVKVKMPGDYVRHIITEPGKPDILSKPVFDIEPYTNNGVLISSLATRLPYGPDFYNYITKILPHEAKSGRWFGTDDDEGIIFRGEVGEQRPTNRKIDMPDTYFGHPMYDYYGIDEENNPEGDKLLWLGEGSVAKPRNIPGFIHSVYKGWRDPEYRRFADSAQHKSDILSNILNISHDFTPLLGPKTPYKDPDYPWDKYPEGDIKVKDEKYNQKIRARIASLEHELKYPTRLNARDKDDIKEEIEYWKGQIDKGFGPAPGDDIIPLKVKDVRTGGDKRIFIPTAHTLNMPLYNWNSRLFDFYEPKQVFEMLENKDSKYNWELWNKANQIADYKGDIDKRYNIKNPYDYVVENAKLAGKGYFDDYARSLDLDAYKKEADPIVKKVMTSKGYSSENHDPEAFNKGEHKVFVTNVTQKPEYHNLGTDTAHLTNMNYEKHKEKPIINEADEKGIQGKDRIRLVLREKKGEASKAKLNDARQEAKEDMINSMTAEDKLNAKKTLYNKYSQDVNAGVTTSASGNKVYETEGNKNKKIKENIDTMVKNARKIIAGEPLSNDPEKDAKIRGFTNIFIDNDIEPSDDNRRIIMDIARENWSELKDKYDSDYDSIWRDIANIYKWRKADFERHMTDRQSDNESIGNILKGVGEFGQV